MRSLSSAVCPSIASWRGRHGGRRISSRPRVFCSSGEAPDGRVVCPSDAETAKTIVSTVNHGTLSTLSEDGTPLGTYVAYVLDNQGCPVLRLRSDAVHKRNLESIPKCSLFVHSPEEPARRLARITLLGKITFIDDNELDKMRESYLERHPGSTGIDQLREKDRFGRLDVDKVFFVGGLTGDGNAKVVSGDDFINSDPDPLRLDAINIVKEWNQDRVEDVIRICRQETKVPLIELTKAELGWVDRLGFYLVYDTINSKHNTIRVAFPREVETDKDVRSLLTMAAHLAWENDKTVIPV